MGEELGPWQKYLQKKKDQKKARRKKKEKKADSLVSDDEEVPDGVDMNDPFFAEEFGEEFKKKEGKKGKNKKNKVAKLDDVITNDNENNGLDLMVMDSDDEKNHLTFKDIVENETKSGKSKKWKKKKRSEIVKKVVEDDFTVDVKDDRFGALFNRAEYNIDPTESNFKKTKNMERIIDEKLKRIESKPKGKEVKEDEPEAKKPKLEAEVSRSLKMVKNKWKQNKSKKGKLKFSVKDV